MNHSLSCHIKNFQKSKQLLTIFSTIFFHRTLPEYDVFEPTSTTFNVSGDRSLFSVLTSLTSSCSPFEHSSLTSVDPEDSSEGRGDVRTDPSMDSFLEIGSEIEVRLAPITASSSTSPSPLYDSRKMFSLLHLLTLWRMNLVISRSGKFVWQFPQIRRSFSCSTEKYENRWKYFFLILLLPPLATPLVTCMYHNNDTWNELEPCCLYEEAVGPWVPIENVAKSLIRLHGCAGWSESSLGAHNILLVLLCSGSNHCIWATSWQNQ